MLNEGEHDDDDQEIISESDDDERYHFFADLKRHKEWLKERKVCKI